MLGTTPPVSSTLVADGVHSPMETSEDQQRPDVFVYLVSAKHLHINNLHLSGPDRPDILYKHTL